VIREYKQGVDTLTHNGVESVKLKEKRK